VQDRATRHEVLRRAIPGVRHALGAASTKNAGKSDVYPRRLTVAERAGMLYGPIAYLRSRAVARVVDGDVGGAPAHGPGLAVDGLAVAVTLVLGGLIAGGWSSPVREVLALGFLTFVPGWALLPGALRAGWPAQAALAVALSLAVVAVASVVMLWLHLWAPSGLFVGLAVISGARVVPRLVRAVRAPPVALGWR